MLKRLLCPGLAAPSQSQWSAPLGWWCACRESLTSFLPWDRRPHTRVCVLPHHSRGRTVDGRRSDSRTKGLLAPSAATPSSSKTSSAARTALTWLPASPALWSDLAPYFFLRAGQSICRCTTHWAAHQRPFQVHRARSRDHSPHNTHGGALGDKQRRTAAIVKTHTLPALAPRPLRQ